MKYKRRHYLIHKGFQFRMIGIVLLLVLGATILTTVVNHFFFLSSIVRFTEEHGRPPTGSELIAASTRPLLVIIPVAFVLLAIICLFISHRIAGPLHRLKMYMDKVQAGDLDVELKFRKGDAIHDVADSFNHMVEGIKKSSKPKNQT
ncbi:HAMP domain-containing protein [candidate division WOR-3 bacterium]|nr:HAMP domain-containing protein [candidate division WOR-3 bacterium]